MMIKGVNKRIVEINRTNNEYFDKAILFVNPEAETIPQNEITGYAQKYLDTLGRKRRFDISTVITVAISAISTLLVTAIALLIFV